MRCAAPIMKPLRQCTRCCNPLLPQRSGAPCPAITGVGSLSCLILVFVAAAALPRHPLNRSSALLACNKLRHRVQLIKPHRRQHLCCNFNARVARGCFYCCCCCHRLSCQNCDESNVTGACGTANCSCHSSSSRRRPVTGFLFPLSQRGVSSMSHKRSSKLRVTEVAFVKLAC